MIDELTITSLVLAAVAIVMVAAIALQRSRLKRRQRCRAVRQARVRPLALMVAEGVAPDEQVDTADIEVLAELVGRYGRQLSGDARERVAEFFRSSGMVARHVRDLGSSRAWRRATAAATLGNMRVPEAVGPLRAALADKDRDVRAAAVTALGHLGAFEAVDAVTRAMAEGTVPRLTGANALLNLGPETLTSLEPLVKDAQPEVRATALEIIGLMGSAKQTSLPVSRLRDEDQSVRRTAATALGRLADREAAAALRQALIDPAPEVRAAAAGALGRIGDRDVADDLLHMASHDSFEVAHAAAEALTALDPRVVIAARESIRAPALREAADLIAIGAA
jgi:HEAT repeat protein